MIFNQNGNATIVAILVLGVAGGYVALNQVKVERVRKQQLRAELKNEMLFLENIVMRKIDCDQTIGGSSCTGTGPIQLKQADGSPVFPGNKMGFWEINAKCDKGIIHTLVTRKNKVDTNKNLIDPLTGYPVENYRIFKPKENICDDTLVKKCTGALLCGINKDGTKKCSSKPTCTQFNCTIDLCGKTLNIGLVAGGPGPTGPPGFTEPPTIGMGSWRYKGCQDGGFTSCGSVIADACIIGKTCGFNGACGPGKAVVYGCGR